MSSQFALPEYPCARVRACNDTNLAPASLAAHKFSLSKLESSKPVRNFIVTYESLPLAPSTTAFTHAYTSSGSLNSELPAPFPVTTLAGHPQFKSTRGARFSLVKYSAASVSNQGSLPMICAPRGIPESSSASYLAHKFLSSFSGSAPLGKVPGTRINSRHASSKPPFPFAASAMRNRASPSPSMGAANVGTAPPRRPRAKSAS